MAIAHVAMPIAAWQYFDYWIPDGLDVVRGDAVRARLGHRRSVGVVVSVDASSDFADRVQPIDALAGIARLPEDLMAMADFVSAYYQAPIGLAHGIYDEGERAIIAGRFAAEDEARRLAESTSIRPEAAAPVLAAAKSTPLAHSVRIAEVARRQDITLLDLFRAVGVGEELTPEAVVSTELELKYEGYFERERVQADKLRRMGAFALDPALPYAEMRSLSFEARQKLAAIRPITLAQAASVPGVSPTDLQNLVIEIEKRRRDAVTMSVTEPR